jgi:hypothetical protein
MGPVLLNAQAHPDSILVGDRKQPQILLVGTFHFGYPNLDSYKVAEEDQVDILSPRRQREVEELVDYLARFRPTMIAVEGGRNSGYILRRYEAWQAGGKEELRPKEIDQLAFRLMDRFGLDTLYGCDAPGLTYTLENHPDSTVFRAYLKKIFEGYDWKSDDPLDSLYNLYFDYDTEITLQLPLLDYFKYLNSDAVIRRYHGAYLVGDFKTEEPYRGADALALYWYSRNLRIVQNIMSLGAGPDDRILVLFGAGHSSILKQQFESTPEYELIPFAALEQWPEGYSGMD